MLHVNLELHCQVEELRWQDVRRDVHKWRLLHGARRRSGWLSQRSCWLLCQLGRWLVKMGQLLQSYGHYEHNWLRS